MKLLVATHVLPYPVDMACKGRMLQMLKHLSSSFELTLVSLAEPRAINDARIALTPFVKNFVPVIAPNKISLQRKAYYRVKTEVQSLLHGVPADFFYANVVPMRKALDSVVRLHGPYRAVLVEYWYTSEMLSRMRGVFKIVDTHDVDFMKNHEMAAHRTGATFAKISHWLHHRNNAAAEMELLRRYDLIVALTETDREIFSQHLGPDKDIIVVPTGVDTEYFVPSGRSKVQHRITFYGAMQVQGNVYAARLFYEKLFPELLFEFPDATYVILGAHPTEEILALGRDPRVVVTGFVPDVRPYLEESSVLICPFQMGYGFRGRVLEAMALEVPVVATSFAVKAMGLKEGEGLLLRDSETSFLQAVAQVLRDPSYALELGKQGRKVVESRFSLAATYGRFCKIVYERLLSPKMLNRA